MDWLDNYLDGLGQYKVTVSPCDTHTWGNKPNLNNQQKKMLFDAAAQSELEYRLIVQESRQAEIDAGMGGSYDAGSAARERPATPAAPSGIPVASTASVVVANIAHPYGDANETYTKISALGEFIQFDGYSIRPSNGVCYRSPDGFVLVPPNVQMQWNDGDWQNLQNRNYWSLAWLRYNDGNMYWSMNSYFPDEDYTFRNDSTDASIIPQSNWYMYNKAEDSIVFTSPLTITAA